MVFDLKQGFEGKRRLLLYFSWNGNFSVALSANQINSWRGLDFVYRRWDVCVEEGTDPV